MKSNTFTVAFVLSASVIALGGCNAPRISRRLSPVGRLRRHRRQ